MEYDHEGRVTNFISGLVLGLVIGAGVAILSAPESGRRTRRRIRRTAGDLRHAATDRWEDLADDLKVRIDDAVKGARRKLP